MNPSVFDTVFKVDTGRYLMNKEPLKFEPIGKVGDMLTVSLSVTILHPGS